MGEVLESDPMGWGSPGRAVSITLRLGLRPVLSVKSHEERLLLDLLCSNSEMGDGQLEDELRKSFFF